MNDWKPIAEKEFKRLFDHQFSELTKEQKSVFARYAVQWWRATLKRFEGGNDEQVIVVAQKGEGILYFDDVEYGFNIATVDDERRIVKPGGAQCSLKEAVEQWFSAV